MTCKTLGMSAPPEMAVETHLHMQHGSKTSTVFLSAHGEASWLLVPISASLLSSCTVKSENMYP